MMTCIFFSLQVNYKQKFYKSEENVVRKVEKRKKAYRLNL